MTGYRRTLEQLKEVMRRINAGEVNPVSLIYWRMHRELNLSMIMEAGGELVLDVGCGACDYMIPLESAGKRCVGIDPIYETSIAECKKKGRELQLIQGIGEYLPFRDEVFDLVLLLSTLQHVKDQEAVLSEARRVLKKGGALAVSVPLNRNALSFRRKKPKGYTMTFSLSDFRRLLVKSGFRISKERCFGFFPLGMSRLLLLPYAMLGDKAVERLIGLLDALTYRLRVASASVVAVCRRGE